MTTSRLIGPAGCATIAVLVAGLALAALERPQRAVAQAPASPGATVDLTVPGVASGRVRISGSS